MAPSEQVTLQSGDRVPWGLGFMFAIRVVSVVGLVFILGMALFALLNFLKFERLYEQEAQLRYDGVARQVAATVVRSLGDGLSLEASVAAQVILDRTAERHDAGLSLYLRQPDGSLVRRNASAPLVVTLPALPDDFAQQAAPVRQLSDTAYFTTVPIISDDRALGALTIAFDAAEQDARTFQLRTQVIRSTLFIALATLPFLAFILIIIMRSSERRARAAALIWRDVIERGRPVTDADIQVDPSLRHVRRMSASLSRDRPSDRSSR